MTPLTVAIIGAGKLGQVHARHWTTLPDVRLAAIIDPVLENARALAVQATPHHPPPVFADLPALLAHAPPDIVAICTPTPTHRLLIEQAAAAKCAVFVEKPLARTLSDCDALVELVRRTGTFLMVGHVVRWFPAYARAKALIASGGVGLPAAVCLSREAAFPRRAVGGTSWYDDPQQSGGVILDILLHDFDWLLWCFGPAERIYARGLTLLPEHRALRDYALVTVRHASGALAHLTGSWAHAGPVHTAFEVCGDGGMIAFDSEHAAPLTMHQGNTRLLKNPLTPNDDPYCAELGAFAAALRSGSAPPVSAEEGREAVRVALAALESLETGRAIVLPGHEIAHDEKRAAL